MTSFHRHYTEESPLRQATQINMCRFALFSPKADKHITRFSHSNISRWICQTAQFVSLLHAAVHTPGCSRGHHFTLSRIVLHTAEMLILRAFPAGKGMLSPPNIYCFLHSENLGFSTFKRNKKSVSASPIGMCSKTEKTQLFLLTE